MVQILKFAWTCFSGWLLLGFHGIKVGIRLVLATFGVKGELMAFLELAPQRWYRAYCPFLFWFGMIIFYTSHLGKPISLFNQHVSV